MVRRAAPRRGLGRLALSEPIITDELAGRVQTLLGEVLRLPHVDVQAFALKAREYGVGLVDPARNRSWIDETVYAGALFRCRKAEAALDAAGGAEVSGEYDE